MTERIPYGVGLILSLEESLRSAFNQPSVTLNKRPPNPGPGFPVSLIYGDTIAEIDDGFEQNVMEILLPGNQPSGFYFGFAATFVMVTHKYILRHASLSVFQEIGELTPLFRAEWDPRAASDATSEHAQPHWHFVQTPERIEGIVRILISPQTEFAAEQTSGLFDEYADCGKFHFAMSPMWDKLKKPSYKQVFESDDFPKWFKNLTNYVAGQIAYIVKKAPATPKEFSPEPFVNEEP